MRVEIWSDVVCPWCYIGKRRLEAALGRFDHAEEVEVAWRSFELDPAARRVREGDPTRSLATKYGITLEEAAAFQARMTEAAAGEGLAFDFSALRPGNSFDAHRLLHLATDEGLGDALQERLFAAYLCEGQAIAEPEVLAGLAVGAGLASERVRAVLDSGAYADQVRAEEAEAAALGINGVPYFVVDHTYGVSGAQRPGLLLAVLQRAWAAGRTTLVRVAAEGGRGEDGACRDGTCIVASGEEGLAASGGAQP